MSLWKIAWRSIQQRALASGLTGLSMALGVTLVVAVMVIYGVIANSFHDNAGLGYDVVVGAKGGKLQLVLNTVFHLSSPVENIPYSYYKEFTAGRFKAYTDKAVPVCLGDYYEDYRVIGTTPAMFDDLEYAWGKRYSFREGTNFKQDQFFTAVIGSTVADKTGLKVGSEFQPSHGVPGGHKHDPFKIVGVLKPTGTPNDRALFVNMEGFYLLENHARELTEAASASEQRPTTDSRTSSLEQPGDTEHPDVHASDKDHHDEDGHHEHADEHDHDEHGHDEHGHDEHDHHHEPLPENQREVTAILVLTAAPPGFPPGLMSGDLVKTINKESVAQAVLPIREITNLFDLFVTPIQLVLLGLTVLIVIVSAIGILVSIYNSMSDRRHEIAVMRALGASRAAVMLIVLLESILLSLAGGLIGWLLGHSLITALNPWITAETGVSIGFFHFVSYELVIIPGLVLLASLVGYLPALAAYRTDVAKALSAAP